MLILWYLLVGTIGVICSLVVAEKSVDAESKPVEMVYKAIVIFFLIVLFLIIALMPNFIGAVIQWIISLFH